MKTGPDVFEKRHLLPRYSRSGEKAKICREPPGTKNEQKALFPLDRLNSRCAGDGGGKNSQRVRHASHGKELHLPDGRRKSSAHFVFCSFSTFSRGKPPVLGEGPAMLAGVSCSRQRPVPGEPARRLEERRLRPTNLNRRKW